MGLFGRKATTVGLDIGSGLIKLVTISHVAGGPVLTKVAFTSIANDAIVEGEIMDPGIVAEAIKELLSSAGVKTKQVVTAVGGRDVIVKKITMDRMTSIKSSWTGAVDQRVRARPAETGRRSDGLRRGKASAGASSDTDLVARVTSWVINCRTARLEPTSTTVGVFPWERPSSSALRRSSAWLYRVEILAIRPVGASGRYCLGLPGSTRAAPFPTSPSRAL